MTTTRHQPPETDPPLPRLLCLAADYLAKRFASSARVVNVNRSLHLPANLFSGGRRFVMMRLNFDPNPLAGRCHLFLLDTGSRPPVLEKIQCTCARSLASTSALSKIKSTIHQKFKKNVKIMTPAFSTARGPSKCPVRSRCISWNLMYLLARLTKPSMMRSSAIKVIHSISKGGRSPPWFNTIFTQYNRWLTMRYGQFERDQWRAGMFVPWWETWVGGAKDQAGCKMSAASRKQMVAFAPELKDCIERDVLTRCTWQTIPWEDTLERNGSAQMLRLFRTYQMGENPIPAPEKVFPSFFPENLWKAPTSLSQ